MDLGPLSWWDSIDITVDTYEGNVIEVNEHTRPWWDLPFIILDAQEGTVLQGKYSRFDIESAVLDNSDALRMAEDLGGRAYREKYSNAYVTIEGTDGLIQGELFWTVDYFKLPGAHGPELSFGIEARTGEVRGDAHIPPLLPR